MVHRTPALLALALCVLANTHAWGADATAPAAAPATQADSEGWIPLFNGRDLKDWTAPENPETFRVEGGEIVIRGERSHLYYTGPIEDHDFTDFDWRCEVMTKPGANSGMYFHTAVQDEGWPAKGYEAQINNSQADPRKTGGLYAVADYTGEPVAKDDAWFVQEVSVRGKHVVVRVDGRVTTDYTEPENPERTAEFAGRLLTHGTFALQGHDPASEVRVRRVEVRPVRK